MLRLSNAFLIICCGFMPFIPASACAPPNYPAGYKSPTFEEVILASFKDARDIVLVRTGKTRSTRTPEPEMGMPNAWVERTSVHPLIAYKGDQKSVPPFVEIGFSGTTCDHRASLVEGRQSLLFFDAAGHLVKSTSEPDLDYEKTLRLVQNIAHALNP